MARRRSGIPWILVLLLVAGALFVGYYLSQRIGGGTVSPTVDGQEAKTGTPLPRLDALLDQGRDGLQMLRDYVDSPEGKALQDEAAAFFANLDSATEEKREQAVASLEEALGQGRDLLERVRSEEPELRAELEETLEALNQKITALKEGSTALEAPVREALEATKQLGGEEPVEGEAAP